MRDLARYRMKTVQARTSEIQRLQKTLETPDQVVLLGRVRRYRGASVTAMIEALDQRGNAAAA